MISTFSTNRAVHMIKSGKTVSLSTSQIVELLINLSHAKKNLPAFSYEEVLKNYESLRKEILKTELDLYRYCKLRLGILASFDIIAPVYLYCGEFTVPEDSVSEERKREYRRAYLTCQKSLETLNVSVKNTKDTLSSVVSIIDASIMLSEGTISVEQFNSFKKSYNALQQITRDSPGLIDNSLKARTALVKEFTEVFWTRGVV